MKMKTPKKSEMSHLDLNQKIQVVVDRQGWNGGQIKVVRELRVYQLLAIQKVLTHKAFVVYGD
jgi:hypothetical protein